MTPSSETELAACVAASRRIANTSPTPSSAEPVCIGGGIWTRPNGAKVAWFKDLDGNTLSVSQH